MLRFCWFWGEWGALDCQPTKKRVYNCGLFGNFYIFSFSDVHIWVNRTLTGLFSIF